MQDPATLLATNTQETLLSSSFVSFSLITTWFQHQAELQQENILYNRLVLLM